MSDYPLGRFVWYQLNAADLDAAVSFYSDLIGFDTQNWEGGDGPYTLFTRGDSPIGGAMNIPEEAIKNGAPQHWLCYIATPDVDKTLMQAKDLGATVLLPPVDMAEVGRFCVIADPQGASIALYAPAEPPQDTPFAPAAGGVSWHELMTTDREAAFGFYRSIAGWDKGEAMDMGEAGIYQLFGRKGHTLGGMFNKIPDMPMPPHWLPYFNVTNVDECATRAASLGGKVLNGPMDVPGGDRIAQCLDPQGGVFAIHSQAS